MATKKETMVNVLNTIRDNASTEYQNSVPEATLQNLADVGNPILTYSAHANEMLTALVDRIGLTLIHAREKKNPLAVLKQGNVGLGLDVQEIYTNPATAETYNPKSTDLLAQTPADTKAAYHRMNRQDRYTVTISREQLQTAFISYENLDRMLQTIVNSLYSGNYIDEFKLMKETFASAITGNKIKKYVVSDVTDETSAKNFITAARKTFKNFQFPSSDFNMWKTLGGSGNAVTTWTEPDDIRFIIRSDVEAFADVNVLASAFNMSKTDFLGKILVTDSFGTTSNCLAIMCDSAFTQIYDNLYELSNFQNGSNLTYNYYLHVWQTYSLSPLVNAVAFTTA